MAMAVVSKAGLTFRSLVNDLKRDDVSALGSRADAIPVHSRAPTPDETWQFLDVWNGPLPW